MHLSLKVRAERQDESFYGKFFSANAPREEALYSSPAELENPGNPLLFPPNRIISRELKPPQHAQVVPPHITQEWCEIDDMQIQEGVIMPKREKSNFIEWRKSLKG